MTVFLQDQNDVTKPRLPVTVRETAGSLEIMPYGYGTKTEAAGHGTPILLELYEGQLRLYAWTDINQDDATHRIDFAKARENYRLEVLQGPDVSIKLYRNQDDDAKAMVQVGEYGDIYALVLKHRHIRRGQHDGNYYLSAPQMQWLLEQNAYVLNFLAPLPPPPTPPQPKSKVNDLIDQLEKLDKDLERASCDGTLEQLAGEVTPYALEQLIGALAIVNEAVRPAKSQAAEQKSAAPVTWAAMLFNTRGGQPLIFENNCVGRGLFDQRVSSFRCTTEPPATSIRIWRPS